jgi:hypothetical protein
MTKIYTRDAWVRDFQPMVNPNNNWGEGATYSSWETYGDDDEYVRQQDNNFVWTEVDGEEGCYIISGYHWINRIHYFITNRPWTDDIEVPTWGYRECECQELVDIDLQSPEFCDECDEGMIDIPIDTVEDLQVIYGKDVEIVG